MKIRKPTVIAILGSLVIIEIIALILSGLLPPWMIWIMWPISAAVVWPAMHIAFRIEDRRERAQRIRP